MGEYEHREARRDLRYVRRYMMGSFDPKAVHAPMLLEEYITRLEQEVNEWESVAKWLASAYAEDGVTDGYGMSHDPDYYIELARERVRDE